MDRKCSARLPDPDKLMDRNSIPFHTWEMEILGKLRVNHDHYEDEEAYIYFINSCTAREAK